jgi:hypothetical protein
MMIEPIAERGHGGYVPLCCALHWIMTDGGARRVALDDDEAWQAATKALFSHIETDEIDMIGRPRGKQLPEKIPGHAIAAIKVLPPLGVSAADVLLDAPSRIDCVAFTGKELWAKDFNDRLYVSGQPTPLWTHLQLIKDDILSRWPRPDSKAKPEQDCYRWLLAQMRQSTEMRPKSRTAEAIEKFPSLGARQFRRAWDRAIEESGATGWSKAGRPSRKSNRVTG